MPAGNGKRTRNLKRNPAPLVRAARNAAFAAAIALDGHEAEGKGDRTMAVKRGNSAVEWLKESLRELQNWLEQAGKK